MKKRFLVPGAVALVLVLSVTAFFAISSHGRITATEPISLLSKNTKAAVSPNVQVFDSVVIKNAAVINGKESPLLCTFENPSHAMQVAKERDAEFLQRMKTKWNLEDFDASSWKTYQKHLIPYTGGKLPDDLGGDKLESQRQEFEGFLAIYGDEELNQKTMRYFRFANFLLQTKLVHQVSLDPVAGNLPADSPSI